MTATTAPSGAAASAVRTGATLMAVAAAGFVGYALLFLVRNFTDSFLELGIGPGEVDVGKDQIQQFSPSLHHYISHLHLAVAAPCWGLASRCPPTTPGTSTPRVTSGSPTWPRWCSSLARCCPARACWTPDG
jgi:hypothetical protein